MFANLFPSSEEESEGQLEPACHTDAVHQKGQTVPKTHDAAPAPSAAASIDGPNYPLDDIPVQHTATTSLEAVPSTHASRLTRVTPCESPHIESLRPTSSSQHPSLASDAVSPVGIPPPLKLPALEASTVSDLPGDPCPTPPEPAPSPLLPFLRVDPVSAPAVLTALSFLRADPATVAPAAASPPRRALPWKTGAASSGNPVPPTSKKAKRVGRPRKQGIPVPLREPLARVSPHGDVELPPCPAAQHEPLGQEDGNSIVLVRASRADIGGSNGASRDERPGKERGAILAGESTEVALSVTLSDERKTKDVPPQRREETPHSSTREQNQLPTATDGTSTPLPTSVGSASTIFGAARRVSSGVRPELTPALPPPVDKEPRDVITSGCDSASAKESSPLPVERIAPSCASPTASLRTPPHSPIPTNRKAPWVLKTPRAASREVLTLCHGDKPTPAIGSTFLPSTPPRPSPSSSFPPVSSLWDEPDAPVGAFDFLWENSQPSSESLARSLKAHRTNERNKLHARGLVTGAVASPPRPVLEPSGEIYSSAMDEPQKRSMFDNLLPMDEEEDMDSSPCAYRPRSRVPLTQCPERPTGSLRHNMFGHLLPNGGIDEQEPPSPEHATRSRKRAAAPPGVRESKAKRQKKVRVFNDLLPGAADDSDEENEGHSEAATVPPPPIADAASAVGCAPERLPLSTPEERELMHKEELEKQFFAERKRWEKPKIPHPPSDENVRDVREDLVVHGARVPVGVLRYLRKYQRDGVQWLLERLCGPAPHGCILADDMGLGKTIQVACLLGAFYNSFSDPEAAAHAADDATDRATRKRPSLIVCPPSLLENWERELTLWTVLDVQIYSNRSGVRERILERVAHGLVNVVLMSRGLFSSDAELGNDFYSTEWEFLVVDECHECKNHKAKLSIALSHDVIAFRRLGITGTPVSNKVGEFWSLLRLVNSVSEWTLEEFDRAFSIPIADGMKRTKKGAEKLYYLVERDRAVANFAKVLAKHVLRRNKNDVQLHLPGKKERIVLCPLSTQQRAAYENLLASPDVLSILDKKRPLCVCDNNAGDDCGCNMGPCWAYLHRPEKDDGDGKVCRSYAHPRKCIALPLMTWLQKIANHLALVQGHFDDEDEDGHDEDTARRLYKREMAELILHDVCGVSVEPLMRSAYYHNAEQCGKLTVLLNLLELWKQDSKLLLFSRSTKLLDIIEMSMKGKGYRTLRLDGKTPPCRRQQLCDHFNTDQSVLMFLISTKAGGTGLNLIAANKVVIFDPDWNPMSDLQAQDRAFRIGQTRFVEVFRFISKETVEEHMYMRQLLKQQVSQMALEGVRSARNVDLEDVVGVERFFVLGRAEERGLLNVMHDAKAKESEKIEYPPKEESTSKESDGRAVIAPAILPDERNKEKKNASSLTGTQEIDNLFEGIGAFDHGFAIREDTQECALADEANMQWRQQCGLNE
eukprot:GEMP01001872.1.p1 GENE.GEMP01001872.1~~GEMP01001872.1.p1  ORF type:complete len:1446 (+),score=385.16 GEMP01001872.1:358-4695(+)